MDFPKATISAKPSRTSQHSSAWFWGNGNFGKTHTHTCVYLVSSSSRSMRGKMPFRNSGFANITPAGDTHILSRWLARKSAHAHNSYVQQRKSEMRTNKVAYHAYKSNAISTMIEWQPWTINKLFLTSAAKQCK